MVKPSGNDEVTSASPLRSGPYRGMASKPCPDTNRNHKYQRFRKPIWASLGHAASLPTFLAGIPLLWNYS